MSQDIHPLAIAASQDQALPPSSGPVFDVKRFLGLRGRMMVVVAICLSIPSVIAAWFLVPVGYTAEAEIRLLAMEPFVLKKPADETPYSTYVNTQISIITGGAVLSRVLETPEVQKFPLITRQEAPVEYLKKCVSARITRGGEIMSVTCSMPEKAAALATLKEVVSEYMSYVAGDTLTVDSERLKFLTQERDTRQLELDAQLKNISELQRTLGIPIVGETPLDTGQPQLYNQKLAEAEEDLVKTQNAQSEAENKLAQIKQLLKDVSKNTPIYDFGVEDRVNGDARVSALRQQVVTLQASLVSTADLEKGSLPTRKIDEKRLSSLRDNLADMQVEVRKEVLESTLTQQMEQIDALNKAVEEAADRKKKYQDLVDNYNSQVEKATDQYAQLRDLQNKAAETRALLDQVQSNIASIKVESNAPGRVQIVSDASVPGGGPDYTPRFMVMVMALAGSVGLAGALGVWRELTDQQVRSTKDLSRLTNLPVIASIPHAEEDDIPEDIQIPLVTELMPLSTLADGYRRVLAQFLNPNMARTSLKSLLVVSPMRGDGKSSLTTNLGVALARAGRRVLLVDLSYRRPNLEKYFDLPKEEGLAEVLGNPAKLATAGRTTRIPGLYVLGPGLDSGDLVGKLASRDMTDFLTAASERFDHIILDSPPWLIMADPRLLAPMVGSVIVVVGSGVSTLGMIMRCLRELRETEANVIGVVLNGVRRTMGGYMKNNRELYHSYSHEGTGQDGRVRTAKEVAVGAQAEDDVGAGD